MSPLEFKSTWQQRPDSPLITFAADVVQTLTLPDDAKRFLIEIGLPDSAAPFLSFGGCDEQKVPTVAEAWGAGDLRYRVIGTNGSGDPICVDTAANGRVVYLNHDRAMRAEFINSSVPQLAYALLAFRSLVEEANAEGGEFAYVEGRIPSTVEGRFVARMREIDPAAIRSDRFWSQEIPRDVY